MSIKTYKTPEALALLEKYIEEYYGGTILIEHDDDKALLAECAKVEKE